MKEKKVRQLAAVMFTDIVGYTALMQENEEVATNIRNRHRDVFQEQHQIHNGEIIQYYGDGTLSVFRSAIEAVKCAMAIQKFLQEGLVVPLRIGIHLGDIVYSKTEVYGDGVNFASRIESMGTAGAILLSDKINDELKNHSGISTKSLGFFELKNIANSVEVFAVSNRGIKTPQPFEIKGKQKPKDQTLAVLPFANMSTNADNEFFSDGISEEIINALAKIKDLKITSRTSSFYFKNKNISVKEIAKQLGVSTILEGSVRLAGNTLRITAQLIQAKEDFHFWSETWDRKLEDIFEIQDEISLLIADKLREHFGHLEIQEHLVEKQTDNFFVYELSLKAKYHKHKWNPEDVKKSISFYKKALDLDPKHTLSMVGLADSYSFMAMTGFMSFEEAWGESTALIHKALKIDKELAGAHYQLANFELFTSGNFKESFRQTLKALRINANHVEAQQFMSFLHIISGNKVKSKQHLDIALSINPLSQETLFYRAYLNYMAEDFEKALEQLNECTEVNPKNIPAIYVKSLCLLMLKRYDDVIPFFDKLPKDIVVLSEKTGAIALSYAFKKDEKNIKKYLNLLIEQAKGLDGFTASSYLFLMYAVLGESDKAFEWVEDAIENKSTLLHLRYGDPLVNNIKSDPRYSGFHKIIFANNKTTQNVKKKKSLLDSNAINNYTQKLLSFIETKKPYLDSGLSLRSLADEIEIHPNQLSWLLNESLGKNFSDYINHYRIETFKQISKDPRNSNITIMGLAYESGFNSKTVFNTYFKKETGLTPKQFLLQSE